MSTLANHWQTDYSSKGFMWSLCVIRRSVYVDNIHKSNKSFLIIPTFSSKYYKCCQTYQSFEALPGGAGYLFPCSPEKIGISLVPQNQNLDFIRSLFHKIAFVPLFPSAVLDFCSLPVINGLIPLLPKLPGMASFETAEGKKIRRNPSLDMDKV